MSDLQPGVRRAHAQAFVAAAKLVSYMTMEMIARSLGCPASTLRDRDPSLVAADAGRVIGPSWSESLINGARTTWIRVSRFAAASGRLPPGGDKYISGYVVRYFLDEVARCASRAYAMSRLQPGQSGADRSLPAASRRSFPPSPRSRCDSSLDRAYSSYQVAQLPPSLSPFVPPPSLPAFAL